MLRIKIKIQAFKLAVNMFYGRAGKKSNGLTLACENIQKESFRVKTDKKNNLYNNLRGVSSLIKKLLKRNNKTPFIIDNSNKIWIYDVGSESIDIRKSHVAYFSKKKIGGAIFKSKLLFAFNFLDALGFVFILSCLMLFISPLLIRRMRHFNWSLFLCEYVENVNLAYLLKKNNINELVFYCIYERDANYAYLLLKKTGINVAKVTSEVPLALWNKIILTDTLVLCSPYQEYEVKEFKSSIKYDEIEIWGPETAQLYSDLYKNRNETFTYTLGFYSTANWLRKIGNEMLDFEDAVEKEDSLKLYLKEFVEKNPSASLIVFLHPREKKEKELSIKHYKTIFQGINYTLNFEKPSAAAFDLCEVGVSFFSTIIFERDFFGYKTIVFPIGYKEFPISGTNWYNNSAYDKNQLFSKLKMVLNVN